MPTASEQDMLTRTGMAIGTITYMNRSPIAPVRLNPDLPAKLKEVTNKALEKDKKLRYQHAADIRTDLQRLKRDSDSGRSAVAEKKSSRRPPKRLPGFAGRSSLAQQFCSSHSAWAAGYSSPVRLMR
jgi:hypothetical protein